MVLLALYEYMLTQRSWWGRRMQTSCTNMVAQGRCAACISVEAVLCVADHFWTVMSLKKKKKNVVMVYFLPHLFICKTKQGTFNLRSCLVSFKKIRHLVLLSVSRSENSPGHWTCTSCKHELVGKWTKKMDAAYLAFIHHDLVSERESNERSYNSLAAVLLKYFSSILCNLRCDTYAYLKAVVVLHFIPPV